MQQTTDTPRPVRRRRFGRLGAVAVLCAATLAATGVAAATAAPAPDSRPRETTNPVGTWSGTVYRTGATESNELSFAPDGRVCLRTEGGGRGSGTWSATGANSFTWQVDEQLYDTAGTYFGHVLIDQAAKQNRSSFRSSGVSQVYDADDNYLGPTDARVVATRTSPVPFGC